jgi:hypothetical protein
MDKYKHFGIQDFKTFYGAIILSEWPVANIYEYSFSGSNQLSSAPIRSILNAKSNMNRSLVIAEFYIQTKFKINEEEDIDKLNPIYIATSHFEQSGDPKYDQN